MLTMTATLMTVAVLASSPVSMEFDGSLKDGLKQLAQKGGLNLVVIGEFDERVQLNLPNVEGEEALETIAQAYGLEVTRSGKKSEKMWVIRRATAPNATPLAAPVAVEEAADRAQNLAQKVRHQADQIREKAQQAAEDARDKAQEAREQAQEAMKQAREKAQEAAEEARDKAEEARDQAREAMEQAREKAQEEAAAAREQAQAAAEAKREHLEALGEEVRNRVSTGGPVTVEKGSKVDTAVAYGGPVVVEEDAVVDGDAVAFGGDVILKKGAVVEGDAVAFGGNVVRADGSSVKGESVSMGGSSFGTAVARSVMKTHRAGNFASADPDNEEKSSRGFGRGLAFFLAQFAVFFGLGFVLMMFAPQRIKALEATIRAEPAKNGLAGFLGLLALVPLTAMLAVTVVGIPVAALMWMSLFVFVPVGLAVVANMLGAKFPTGRVRKTQALVLATGLLVMMLIGRIPVLGPTLLVGAVFVSMGAIIRTRFGERNRGTPILDPVHTGSVV